MTNKKYWAVGVDYNDDWEAQHDPDFAYDCLAVDIRKTEFEAPHGHYYCIYDNEEDAIAREERILDHGCGIYHMTIEEIKEFFYNFDWPPKEPDVLGISGCKYSLDVGRYAFLVLGEHKIDPYHELNADSMMELEYRLEDATKPYIYEPNTKELRECVKTTVCDVIQCMIKEGAFFYG